MSLASKSGLEGSGGVGQLVAQDISANSLTVSQASSKVAISIPATGGLAFNGEAVGAALTSGATVVTDTGSVFTIYYGNQARLTIDHNTGTVQSLQDLRSGTTIASNTARLASIPTGTGLTTNYSGDLRRAMLKFTTTFAAWSAAALTKDITIGTLPAQARVVSVTADTTVAYILGAGTISLTVGKSAGGAEYLASHDVKTAIVTKGLADADMGTALTRAAAVQGGDIPSWTSTTALQARITSSAGNLSTMSAGSTTFYVTVEFM